MINDVEDSGVANESVPDNDGVSIDKLTAFAAIQMI